MSRENVELVKRILPPPGADLTALSRDDSAWAPLRDEMEPYVEPDCQFVMVAWGQRFEFTGLDGLREGWSDWLSPWASYHSETEDILDFGDHVLVLVRDRGRPHDTDAEVEMRGAGVCLVRNGKIARVGFYASRDEAFEVVGLSEKRVGSRPPASESKAPRR